MKEREKKQRKKGGKTKKKHYLQFANRSFSTVIQNKSHTQIMAVFHFHHKQKKYIYWVTNFDDVQFIHCYFLLLTVVAAVAYVPIVLFCAGIIIIPFFNSLLSFKFYLIFRIRLTLELSLTHSRVHFSVHNQLLVVIQYSQNQIQ